MNKYKQILDKNGLSNDDLICDSDLDILIELFLAHRNIVLYNGYTVSSIIDMYIDIQLTADSRELYVLSESGQITDASEVFVDEYDFKETCADMLYEEDHSYYYIYDSELIKEILYDEERLIKYLEENDVLVPGNDDFFYQYIVNPELLAERTK